MTKRKRQRVKRRVLRLQWIGGEWVLREGRQTSHWYGYMSRRYAEKDARHCCRHLHAQGHLVQLVIHNRDGSIGRGGRAEATYGNDPRGTKG